MGSQPVRVAGCRPQGLWARSLEGLGPGPQRQGPGAFSPQKPPKLRFFASLLVGLAKAWVSAETACWGSPLHQFFRRSEKVSWSDGGGGLEGSGHGIPPTPPPRPPSPPFLGRPFPLLKPSNTPPKVGGPPTQSLLPQTLKPQSPGCSTQAWYYWGLKKKGIRECPPHTPIQTSLIPY